MYTKPQQILLLLLLCTLGLSLVLASYPTYAQELKKNSASESEVAEAFATLVKTSHPLAIDEALALIDKNWKPAYVPQLLESLSLVRSFFTFQKIEGLLSDKTRQQFDGELNDWFFWLWNQPEQIGPDYANFKAGLYGLIDPKFKTYFQGRQSPVRIRLDEIRWGGVVQDGIPPLRQPKMVTAKQANYLKDDNIVFGIEVNGDVRAYPKRIMAWHEMFVDTIGGVDIAGVYCTLCGAIIPFKTQHNGVNHQLGTSGFLYRSNKLMYDQATQSLWSTIRGEPVVGPLVDKGIALEPLSIVTTTWGEWKRRHPNTQVLSLDTGHSRDYGEGVAYKEYFATDRLMFNTPFQDDRLNNKQEVLALRFPASPKEQLAIDTDFLNQNPLYKDNIGPQQLLVLTDNTGANRVYDPKNVDFVSYDQDKTVVDANGNRWLVAEDRLVAEKGGKELYRLPYHRAFWFGWHAVFPETRLVK